MHYFGCVRSLMTSTVIPFAFAHTPAPVRERCRCNQSSRGYASVKFDCNWGNSQSVVCFVFGDLAVG